MKKYLHSFLRYFLFSIIGFILFFIFSFLTRHLNEFLSGIFPTLFKIYNPVSNREELVLQNQNIALISAIASVFTLTLIAIWQDNLRYEHLISKTDGFYTIKQGAEIYRREFLGADLFSSVIVPAFFLGLTLINIPNSAPRILRVLGNCLTEILVIPLAFTERLGFILGGALLIFVSVASRIPTVYLSLAHWRGIWLSSTER